MRLASEPETESAEGSVATTSNPAVNNIAGKGASGNGAAGGGARAKRAADTIWVWTVAFLIPGGAWGLWSGFAASQFWFPPANLADRLQASPSDLVFVFVAVVGAAAGGAAGAFVGNVLGRIAAALTGRR